MAEEGSASELLETLLEETDLADTTSNVVDKAVVVTGEDPIRRFQEFPVTLKVEIGRTRRSLKDWLEIGVGSRISLEESWRQPVHVLINGRPVGRGIIVLVGNRFGVRITEWGVNKG
jgi:flagellar motor switch protein FliN/FliY